MVVDRLQPDSHLIPGRSQETLKGGDGRFFAACLISGDGLLADPGNACHFVLCQPGLVSCQSNQTGCECRCHVVLAH
jgi:hypothetical protein